MIKIYNKHINQVKQEFLNKNLFPLFDDYNGNKQKLLAQTPEGYLVVTSFRYLKDEHIPNIVDTHNPYSIQNIKLWCKLNNKQFELLSEEYKGTSKKLKWKCLKEGCEEIFDMSWSCIQRGQSCPYCSGKKISLTNCLATKNPQLASEWHPTLNGDLTPWNVTCGNGSKVWWKCEKGHEWEAVINSRNNNIKCPICSGRQTDISNCLATKRPDIAKEWHPIKNGDLTPYDVTCGSKKDIWWICDKGHEWKTSVCNRNNNTQCPYCIGKLASEEYNLFTCLPDICKDWDYIKNIKLPQNYTPKSHQSVFWKCHICNHEWFSQIDSRTSNDCGCPQCVIISKTNNQLEKYCIVNNLDYYREYKINECRDKRPLPFDICIIFNNNLNLIEADGHQHFYPVNFGGISDERALENFKITQYHDEIKNKYCEDNNINLLRIPYWEFDNIEEILSEYLNINIIIKEEI